MPLARIITNAVDESLELSMQLRARGFRVETVAPGKIPTTPADLEVRLDECAPEEIVARAADVDPNDNLWVFVAPGALDERARPTRVISLVPQALARSSEAMPLAQPVKAIDTEAVRFAAAEDDPILAELEHDVILDEQETAKLREAASEISRLETTASLDQASTSKPSIAVSQPQPAKQPDESALVITVSKAKAAAAANGNGLFSIPRIPDRTPNQAVAKSGTQPKARPAVYKITFQTGPSFWRAAWVSGMLVVLLGVLALILEMKPHSPANAAKPASAQSDPSVASPSAPSPKLPDPEVNLRDWNSASSDAATSHLPTPAAPASSAKLPKNSHHVVRTDDIVAEDTVVFYDRPHRPGSSKAAAQDHSRKYSDQN
jgi:hypothetical protein